jgi:hypothetical protein
MAVTKLAVAGITSGSFNTSAAAAAVADATGANATSITVIVSEHEVNASLYLFYLSSAPQFTYSMQALLRSSLLANLSATAGSGNAAAAAGITLSVGALSVVTAEFAAADANAQQVAVARRRLFGADSSQQRRSSSSGGGSRRLMQRQSDSTEVVDTTAAAAQQLYAVRAPLTMTGFGGNTALATSAASQLNGLLDSPWLSTVMAAGFARNGVTLDSVSGNSPMTTVVLSVAVNATDSASAAYWSGALARATADTTLGAAMATRLGVNVTLLPRGDTVRLPKVTKLDKVLHEVDELAGNNLAGVVIGAIVALIIIIIICVVLACMHRRARALKAECDAAVAAKTVDDAPLLEPGRGAGEGAAAGSPGGGGRDEAPGGSDEDELLYAWEPIEGEGEPEEGEQAQASDTEEEEEEAQEESGPASPASTLASLPSPPVYHRHHHHRPLSTPPPPPPPPLTREEDLEARAQARARSIQAEGEVRLRAQVAAAESAALAARSRAAEARSKARRAEAARRDADARTRASLADADRLRAVATGYALQLSTTEAALATQGPSWVTKQ